MSAVYIIILFIYGLLHRDRHLFQLGEARPSYPSRHKPKLVASYLAHLIIWYALKDNNNHNHDNNNNNLGLAIGKNSSKACPRETTLRERTSSATKSREKKRSALPRGGGGSEGATEAIVSRVGGPSRPARALANHCHCHYICRAISVRHDTQCSYITIKLP